jgi:broad specificity phosphatase PhoE
VIARDSVKALFLRHPDSTVQGKISKGQTDYPLSDEGKKQGTAMADTAAKFKPKVVFSSPLTRAAEPAKQLADKAGAQLKVTSKLLPWDFGRLEGQPERKVEPILRSLWKDSPDSPAGDTGESFNKSLERERGFVNEDLKPAMNEGLKPAVVFHSRQSRQLPHLIQGKPTADPTTGGLPPAGIQALDKRNKFVRIRREGPA